MTLPSVAMSIQAGWARTPRADHDFPVLSHNIGKDFTFVRETNFFASDSESWVPRPTTSMFLLFCRTNRSTPGASRAHAVQCGAQNHTSNGFLPEKTLARFTDLPVRTSVTDTEGRGFVTFAAVLSVVAAPTASGLCTTTPITAPATMAAEAIILRRGVGRDFSDELTVKVFFLGWSLIGGRSGTGGTRQQDACGSCADNGHEGDEDDVQGESIEAVVY